MGVATDRYVRSARPIDQDEVSPEAVLMVDFAEDPLVVLRPLIDAVWNAAGWPKSPLR
jgi:hypothetical protein